MFKTIIFDLDGTLCDTLPLAIECFRRALFPIYKRELHDEEITKYFGASEEGTIEKLAPCEYQKTLNAYWDNLRSLHEMCKYPFQGMEKILQFLKNKDIRLFVVTGRTLTSAKITLDYMDLTKYFEKIYGGVKDHNNKSEQINSIILSNNFDKNDVLYVGDTPSDIIEARKSGIKIASSIWGTKIEEEKVLKLNPDYIFYNTEAFYSFIEKNYRN